MDKILVTGASGFLGSILVDKLLRENYKVFGIDRRGSGNLSQEILNNRNFTLLNLDISRKNWMIPLKGIKVDGIFHLASRQPSNTNISYDDFYRGNVQTTLNLIDFIRNKKIKFIVFTSTIAFLQKRNGTRYIDELSNAVPKSCYSLTKYLSERLLDICLSNTDTKVIITCFPSLFGKCHLGGIVHTYYELAKKKRDIEVYGEGKIYRNLLYSDDAIRILIELSKRQEKCKKFDIFVCGSRDSLRMSELARIIKVMSSSSSKIILKKKATSVEEDVFISNKKIRDFIGFNPHSIEEGLKLYFKEKK